MGSPGGTFLFRKRKSERVQSQWSCVFDLYLNKIQKYTDQIQISYITSVAVKHKYVIHCISNTNTYFTPSLDWACIIYDAADFAWLITICRMSTANDDTDINVGAARPGGHLYRKEHCFAIKSGM